MNTTSQTRWIAFADNRCLASGDPRNVAAIVKGFTDQDPAARILIFDADTSATVELDLRGSAPDVVARLAVAPAPAAAPDAPAARPLGRPKLGVVAREVTLFPRHWEWLAGQPGGASVTLRKLVEQAMRSGGEAGRVREARDAAWRFMHVMAGDAPGFEEACRALYAGDLARLAECTAGWPADIRDHARALAARGAVPA